MLSEAQTQTLLRAGMGDRVTARGNRGRSVESLAKRGFLALCPGQGCLGADYEITEAGRAALPLKSGE